MVLVENCKERKKKKITASIRLPGVVSVLWSLPCLVRRKDLLQDTICGAGCRPQKNRSFGLFLDRDLLHQPYPALLPSAATPYSQSGSEMSA